MAVLKEFECEAHGDFEAMADDTAPTCPHGCGPSMVQRVFRTAPAFQSQGYRNINGTLETLAREHGLTDMNQRGGDGMRRMDWQANRRIGQATDMLIQNAKNEANRGRDAGDFFRPLGNPGIPGFSTAQGVVTKSDTRTVTDKDGRTRSYGVGSTVLSNGLELGIPNIVPAAAPYDGRSNGVPRGDA